MLSFVDGQTTNPSLIAKNPEIRKRVASERPLSRQEENEEYKNIVQQISPLVGDAGISIEVFADLDTPAEQMLTQCEEVFTWILNAYIKYPCMHDGPRAARISVCEGSRVNMTLCFSQEQAAAVYGARKGTAASAYVSPFVGRLDDRGENGMDLIRNFRRMYDSGDGMPTYWLRASAISITCWLHLRLGQTSSPCQQKCWKTGRRRDFLCQKRISLTEEIHRMDTSSGRYLTKPSAWTGPGRSLTSSMNSRRRGAGGLSRTIKIR